MPWVALHKFSRSSVFISRLLLDAIVWVCNVCVGLGGVLVTCQERLLPRCPTTHYSMYVYNNT